MTVRLLFGVHARFLNAFEYLLEKNSTASMTRLRTYDAIQLVEKRRTLLIAGNEISVRRGLGILSPTSKNDVSPKTAFLCFLIRETLLA